MNEHEYFIISYLNVSNAELWTDRIKECNEVGEHICNMYSYNVGKYRLILNFFSDSTAIELIDVNKIYNELVYSIEIHRSSNTQIRNILFELINEYDGIT